MQSGKCRLCWFQNSENLSFTNKNIKIGSFESNAVKHSYYKTQGGLHCAISDNETSLLTLGKLALNDRNLGPVVQSIVNLTTSLYVNFLSIC